MMFTKSQWVAVALCVGAVSANAATCTSTTNLGGLGPPDVALFGNSFSTAGSYVDCFQFTLNGAATSFGGVLEVDPLLNKLNLDIQSISLFSGNSVTALQTDMTPLMFSFGGLLGGVVYTLQVASTVGSTAGLFNLDVGYAGTIVTLASAAPEPSAYALAIAGLAVVGAGALRARRR